MKSEGFEILGFVFVGTLSLIGLGFIVALGVITANGRGLYVLTPAQMIMVDATATAVSKK